MAVQYEESNFDFDFDFLNPGSNISVVSDRTDKPEKSRKAILIVKKKIVATDSLIRRYYEKRDEAEQFERALQTSKEECIQTCLGYKDIAEKLHQIEKEVETLRHTNAELEEKCCKSESVFGAIQSHANQLQILVKEHEITIDSLTQENILLKTTANDCEKNIVTLQKENADLIKDICLMKNIISGKTKLNKRSKTILQKYEKCHENEDDGVLFKDDSDTDFENRSVLSPIKIPAIEIENSIRNKSKDTCVTLKDDNEHDSDCSNELASRDTGRGSSLAFSDGEKCYNSPDYYLNHSPVNTLHEKERRNYVDAATSPIHSSQSNVSSVEEEVLRITSPVCNIETIQIVLSPINNEEDYEAEYQIESDLPSSADKDTNADIATSSNGIIEPCLAEKISQETCRSIFDISDPPGNVIPDESSSPDNFDVNIRTSDNNCNNNETFTEKDGSEYNNSNCFDETKTADCEIEMILNKMRFNRTLITPIPSTPSKSRKSSASAGERCAKTSYQGVYVCKDAAQVKEENKILQQKYNKLEQEVTIIKDILKNQFIFDSRNSISKPSIYEEYNVNNSFQTIIENTESHQPQKEQQTENVQKISSETLTVNSAVKESTLSPIVPVLNSSPIKEMPGSNSINIEYEDNHTFFDNDIETSPHISCQEKTTKERINVNNDKAVHNKHRKLSKLDKLRKNFLPKTKIKRTISKVINKKRIKPKEIPLHKKLVVESDNAATLNNKNVYEKAVQIMTKLKSQQNSTKINEHSPGKKSQTNIQDSTPKKLESINMRYESPKQSMSKVVQQESPKNDNKKTVNAKLNFGKDDFKLSDLFQCSKELVVAVVKCDQIVKSPSPQKQIATRSPNKRMDPIANSSENNVLGTEKVLLSEPLSENAVIHKQNKSKHVEEVAYSNENKIPERENVLTNSGLVKNTVFSKNGHSKCIEETKNTTESVNVCSSIPKESKVSPKPSRNKSIEDVANCKEKRVSESECILFNNNVEENLKTPKKKMLNEVQHGTRKRQKSDSTDNQDVPNKRILRSTTSIQTTSESDNNLVVSVGKITASPDKNRLKNHDKVTDVFSHSSQLKVLNYGDLDMFENDQDTTINHINKHSKGKSVNANEVIFCAMLEKYGKQSKKNAPKKVRDSVLTLISTKLDEEIMKISELNSNEAKKAMNNLVETIAGWDLREFMTAFMVYLKDPQRKIELYKKIYSHPAPPMTKSEQILLYVVTQLKVCWKSFDFINCLLCNIEYVLFKLNQTPDFETIESMAHFYALICRYFKMKSRLRLFMLDAMYCIKFKAVPLIKQCLDVYMHVLPLAHMGIAKNPLVTCMVYLLHFYKCDDKFNRVQEIRNILNRKYFYEITEWNDQKIIEMFTNAIKDIRAVPVEMKMLRVAMVLVSKRLGPKWCQTNIVKNLLLPMITKDVPNRAKIFCISMLGPLLKPYPADMKAQTEVVFNLLLDNFKQNNSPEIKEAVVTSLIYMSKHNQTRLLQTLLAWKPQKISPQMEITLRDFVQEKPLKVWKAILSKIQLVE